VSLNTSQLEPAAAEKCLEEESKRLGLPVADPIRAGAAFERLVNECLLL
jgi:uncharacterized NAD-dependent epimerase/dehydratase family protein